MKVPLVILLVLLFSAVGCAVNKETEGIEIESEKVTFFAIAEGEMYGAGEEGFSESRVVVQSQEAWEKLKKQMDAVNDVTSAFRQEEIDFDREQIVVCIDKVRNSGGHQIKIKEVQETKDELIIIIEKISPSGMATSVLTQPFSIVRIPRSEKEVVFKVAGD